MVSDGASKVSIAEDGTLIMVVSTSELWRKIKDKARHRFKLGVAVKFYGDSRRKEGNECDFGQWQEDVTAFSRDARSAIS